MEFSHTFSIEWLYPFCDANARTKSQALKFILCKDMNRTTAHEEIANEQNAEEKSKTKKKKKNEHKAMNKRTHNQINGLVQSLTSHRSFFEAQT